MTGVDEYGRVALDGCGMDLAAAFGNLLQIPTGTFQK